MTNKKKYEPGNPEYDFWNDKNLYPDLRSDESHSSIQQGNDFAESGVSIGTVFLIIFGWIVVWAPFALLCTWENIITQVVFWSGVTIIIVVFVLWLCGVIEKEGKKK